MTSEAPVFTSVIAAISRIQYRLPWRPFQGLHNKQFGILTNALCRVYSFKSRFEHLFDITMVNYVIVLKRLLETFMYLLYLSTGNLFLLSNEINYLCTFL